MLLTAVAVSKLSDGLGRGWDCRCAEAGIANVRRRQYGRARNNPPKCTETYIATPEPPASVGPIKQSGKREATRKGKKTIPVETDTPTTASLVSP